MKMSRFTTTKKYLDVAKKRNLRYEAWLICSIWDIVIVIVFAPCIYSCGYLIYGPTYCPAYCDIFLLDSILIIFSYLTAYCDRPCLRWQRGGGAPEDYKNMNFPGFNLFWFWSFIFVWETRCFRRTSFLSRIQSVRPPTYSFWVRCRGIFHFRTAFCLRGRHFHFHFVPLNT